MHIFLNMKRSVNILIRNLNTWQIPKYVLKQIVKFYLIFLKFTLQLIHFTSQLIRAKLLSKNFNL